MPDQWHNRITGYGEEAPDTLLANPRNFRRHPKHQQDALAGVLQNVGVVQNVIVNRTTGLVVDGHARIALAIRDGQTTIPITYVELSEDEEALVLATLDPIAALATVDAEILENLLRDVTTGDAAVQAMLDALAVDAGIVPGLADPGDGGDDFDTTPDDGPTRVQRGELWQLGEHRLLCGDSTNADDVARLMDGERADMMFTDPPYGVDYTGGHFHSGNVNIKRERERLHSDKTPDIYGAFLPVVLPVIDGPCYVWFADSRAQSIYNAVNENKCDLHALIIWHKTNATYPAMNAQYKPRHEPLLYFKPKGSTLRWIGATNECTLWEIKRDARNEFHPTQKPIELADRAIRNHNAPIVADFFGGSGFTLIAAERNNRQARIMEIEPKYCDVIIRRWEAETGRSAEKVG